MSIANNFPEIKPSLSLDFANTKKLDPRITFARASGATFYDGKTVAKAEENLLLQSQTFSTFPWSTLRTVLTGSQTAPDGTSTAFKFQSASGETTAPNLNQTVSVSSGLDYVISIHAKAGDRNFIRFSEAIQTGSAVLSGFDLSTGTVSASGSGHTNSIVDLGDGWYRCIVKLTVNATRSASTQFLATESGTSNTVADDEGFIEIWGAQVEARDSVTAYTPTTTQPITNYIPVLQTAPANVARFNHNPVTGESLGLLVEEQRTNLVLRSEEFNDAYWTKTNTTITADTIVAPDGTLTGDKLVESTATSTHDLRRDIAVTTGTAYTHSIFVKAGERLKFRVVLGSAAFGVNVSVDFDLSAVTATVTTAGTNTSATITPVGNNWYRCTTTSTTTATATAITLVRLIESGTTTSYTGDGYSGIYIWGAQLEAASKASTYIKTEASQVTRSAEPPVMSGANFSSWFRQDEGTFVFEGSLFDRDAGKAHLTLRTDTSNFMRIRTAPTGTGVRYEVTDGGVSQVSLSPTVLNIDDFSEAFTYKRNDFAAVVGGGNADIDTSGIVPTVDEMFIGQTVAGATQYNGHIKKIAYYPKALTNAQLQALTS